MQTTRTSGLRWATTLTLLLACTIALLAGTAAASPTVTDTTITDAVEDELFLDAAIRAHLIDVATTEGVVTLSGSVDNLLARERAARIADMVKGVRAVVNTIKVLPPILRSDSEIEADVAGALLADPATDAYEVDVAVKNRAVTLTGTVNSWQERELAGRVAMGVKGVQELHNDLVFTYADDRPDNDIAQDIRQALRWDVLVDHALIEVDVTGGKVTLSGTVGSLAEKRQAIADAYVANVTDVDAGRLTVRRWARDPQLRGDKYRPVADDSIREALADALFYDPRVSLFDVTPEVRSGVITLRGKVDNLKARRAARQTAANTVGVVRVVNRIKVRPQAVIDDATIHAGIEAALARDPVVESYEITVTVRNGVADLFGSVGTVFEKNQAEDLAARVNGVIAVNNFIVVSAAARPRTFDPFPETTYTTRNFAPHYGPPARLVKTDADIQADIKDQLFWSPFVDDANVNVSVDEGRATLTGSVDSRREWHAAMDNAYQGGATFVENQLIIR